MTTRPSPTAPRAAIRRAETDAGRRAVAACLARHGLAEVTEFAPRNDDELNQALRAGRFDVVVFHDLDAALTMLWKEKAAFEQWQAAGVRVLLAEDPGGHGADLLAFLAAVGASHVRWRLRQARREIVAGVVLSAAALLALAGLFWLAH